jgi:NADPH:quinone reductase-like Zn-dependent oxidoreductase
MRAFTVQRYGDKVGVRAGEAPAPTVGANVVLVRIQAASNVTDSFL